MRAIVEVLSGSHTGCTLEVYPGRPLRFGRTAKADLALTEDSYLSSVHFALESDGEKCVLHDLGSSNGTFLNGTRVSPATLQHGDSISAGQTTFLFHLDRDLEPTGAEEPSLTKTTPFVRVALPAPEPAVRTATMDVHRESPEFSAAQLRLAGLLRREPDPLFAVVDAARDRGLQAMLESSAGLAHPLWRPGQTGIEEWAPCLVSLPGTSRLLENLIGAGWARQWGVYLTSAASAGEIAAHLARFLRPRTEDGEAFHLRFHDPRILRALLATSTPLEAAQFFGPVRCYLLEGPDPNT
ncbi:MAG: DUF4123 domain-containing protein, partial [Pseudomonadota bacterium]